MRKADVSKMSCNRFSRGVQSFPVQAHVKSFGNPHLRSARFNNPGVDFGFHAERSDCIKPYGDYVTTSKQHQPMSVAGTSCRHAPAGDLTGPVLSHSFESHKIHPVGITSTDTRLGSNANNSVKLLASNNCETYHLSEHCSHKSDIKCRQLQESYKARHHVPHETSKPQKQNMSGIPHSSVSCKVVVQPSQNRKTSATNSFKHHHHQRHGALTKPKQQKAVVTSEAVVSECALILTSQQSEDVSCNSNAQELAEADDHVNKHAEADDYVNKQLQLFVKSNKLQQVENLLKRGASVNYVDKTQQSSLFLACSVGAVEMTELLLKLGALASVGTSPLIAAARCGSLACVQLLLDHGAEVNKKNAKRQQTALHVALQQRHHKVVVLLLDRGADPRDLYKTPGGSKLIDDLLADDSVDGGAVVEMLFRRGFCPNRQHADPVFHYAFQHGLHDTALLMLQMFEKEKEKAPTARPDVNERKRRTTALVCSAKHNWPGVIMTLLLQNKVDVNCELPGHGSALEVAQKAGNDQILNMLLQFGARRPRVSVDSNSSESPAAPASNATVPLNAAESEICGRSVDDVERSLQQLTLAKKVGHVKPVETEGVFSWNFNDLLQAIAHLNVDAVRRCIIAGADVKYRPAGGSNETLLHVACSQSHNVCLDHAAAMGDQGGNRNHPKQQSVGCFHLAIIVKMLLDHGVDINATTDDGETALFRACKNSHYAVVDVLLEQHCDISSSPAPDKNPLVFACKKHDVSLVRALLKAKGNADSHVATKSETLLHFIAGVSPNKRANNSSNSKQCQEPACVVVANEVLSRHQSHTSKIIQQQLQRPKGSIEIMQLLIEHGADCNAVCASGETPLFRATITGSSSAVSLLLNSGSDPNFTTTNRYPLFAALLTGNREIVRMLRRADAKVEIVTCGSSYGVDGLDGTTNTAYRDMLQMIGSSSAELRASTLLISACLLGNKNNLLHRRHYDLDLRPGLHLACDQGSPAAVQMLLEKGADIDAKDVRGMTALHCCIARAKRVRNSSPQQAARLNYLNVLNCLVAHKPSFDVLDLSMCSPLYYACLEQLVDVVETLLKSGANPNEMRNPLRLAFQKRNFEMVELLLKHGAVSKAGDKSVYDVGDVPICVACQTNNIRLLRTLLQHKPDVNERDQTGFTALHHVVNSVINCNSGLAEKAAFDCLDALLENGADVDASEGVDGFSPLCVAVLNSREDLVAKMLIRKAALKPKQTDNSTQAAHRADRNSSPVIVAAKNGFADVLRILFSYEEDIDERDNDGNTALHFVIQLYTADRRSCFDHNRSDWKAALDVLLDSNASANIINGHGETPLYMAVNRDLPQLCRRLLDYGADPNVGGPDKLPLVRACHKHNAEIVENLLEHRAHPDGVASCGKRRDDVIKSEVADAAAVVKVGPYRELPLCIAVKNGRSEVVDLLLQHGASVDLLDVRGLGPLHRAVQFLCTFSDWSNAKSDDELVALLTFFVRKLVEHGADVDLTSFQRLRPIHHALSVVVNLRLMVVSSLLRSVFRAGRADTLKKAALNVVKILVENDASLSGVDPPADRKPVELRKFLTTASTEDFSFLMWLFQAGIEERLLSMFCRALSEPSSTTLHTGMCKAVVLAGHKVTDADIAGIEKFFDENVMTPKAVDAKSRLVAWLRVEQHSPPTLLRLSRTAVRQELSSMTEQRNILPTIDSFDIAETFRSYLKFEMKLSDEICLLGPKAEDSFCIENAFKGDSASRESHVTVDLLRDFVWLEILRDVEVEHQYCDNWG